MPKILNTEEGRESSKNIEKKKKKKTRPCSSGAQRGNCTGFSRRGGGSNYEPQERGGHLSPLQTSRDCSKKKKRRENKRARRKKKGESQRESSTGEGCAPRWGKRRCKGGIVYIDLGKTPGPHEPRKKKKKKKKTKKLEKNTGPQDSGVDGEEGADKLVYRRKVPVRGESEKEKTAALKTLQESPGGTGFGHLKKKNFKKRGGNRLAPVMPGKKKDTLESPFQGRKKRPKKRSGKKKTLNNSSHSEELRRPDSNTPRILLRERQPYST